MFRLLQFMVGVAIFVNGCELFLPDPSLFTRIAAWLIMGTIGTTLMFCNLTRHQTRALYCDTCGHRLDLISPGLDCTDALHHGIAIRSARRRAKVRAV